MTDEQYIDDLFAKELCGYEKTPGFRAFLLDAMAMIGERPHAGDVASMHMAHRAGRESVSPLLSTGSRVKVISKRGASTKGTGPYVMVGVGCPRVEMDSHKNGTWCIDACDLEKVQP